MSPWKTYTQSCGGRVQVGIESSPLCVSQYLEAKTAHKCRAVKRAERSGRISAEERMSLGLLKGDMVRVLVLQQLSAGTVAQLKVGWMQR